MSLVFNLTLLPDIPSFHSNYPAPVFVPPTDLNDYVRLIVSLPLDSEILYELLYSY